MRIGIQLSRKAFGEAGMWAHRVPLDTRKVRLSDEPQTAQVFADMRTDHGPPWACDVEKGIMRLHGDIVAESASVGTSSGVKIQTVNSLRHAL